MWNIKNIIWNTKTWVRCVQRAVAPPNRLWPLVSLLGWDLASKLINYFQMLNFSLALPIRLRLGSKGETAKSSKDPSKAALMSRRCHCDKVRCAAHSCRVYGLLEARIGSSGKAVTVWFDKVVQWKPNQTENIYGQSLRSGLDDWEEEAETTFD